MKARIKNYFITGLLVIIPAGLTIYILDILIGMMDRVLNYLPLKFHPDTYLPFHIPGLGLIATAVLTFLVGILTQNLLGKKLVYLWEWAVSRIPFVRSIYLAIKQLVEAIFAQNSKGFKRVVLVEFPRKELWSLGFLTGVVGEEIQDKIKERVISVFIPNVPNPTTGFYLMVPEKDVINLDMTVEDAFKLAMSGGIVTPSEQGNHNSQISKIDPSA
ncbi:MAG: Transporter [bacterium]|nr:MAG: Transporter [bacterium]